MSAGQGVHFTEALATFQVAQMSPNVIHLRNVCTPCGTSAEAMAGGSPWTSMRIAIPRPLSEMLFAVVVVVAGPPFIGISWTPNDEVTPPQ